MMIRHYYLEDFNGIAGSGIRHFSITGGVDEGEASVPAIQSVLWRTYKDILNAGRNINDIATGSYSTKIAIKNTHKVMWNILSNSQTNSTIKSYSAYANFFTINYPEYRSDFGRISAIHGMSPKNVTFSTYSESESPTISWQNSFVSTNYGVNNYSLVFYDNSNYEILRINNINTTSHKLSYADWTQVKNNFGNGDHVNIHVLAFQTNTPTTGGFISQAFKLSHLIYTPINNGDAYSITGILNKHFTGSIEILDIYQEKPVTQIGDSAFRDSSMSNISIPSSVTNIGSSAFKNCAGLTNITLPNNLSSIGAFAFEGCINLSEIHIPSSVTQISKDAFYKTNNIPIYMDGRISVPSTFDANWNSSGNPVYLNGSLCTHNSGKTLIKLNDALHGYLCNKCRTITSKVGHTASGPYIPLYGMNKHYASCICGTIIVSCIGFAPPGQQAYCYYCGQLTDNVLNRGFDDFDDLINYLEEHSHTCCNH